MLSDKPHKAVKRSLPRRAVSGNSKQWSDSQKIECVTTYLALGGDVPLTSRTLGIPDYSIYMWRKTEWWHHVEEEIKKQEKLTLSVTLKKLVDSSLSIINDRLTNGDWIYDQKTGEMKRKPVIMKDAHKVAVDLIDKRLKLEDQAQFTVAQENIQDKLNQLAKSFSELASKKPDSIEVTDVIFGEEKVDAVHEEREA